MKFKKLMFTFALALVCTACATGNGNDEDKGGKGGNQSDRKGPPAEAFTACENLSVGDACTVSTSRGSMEGSCKAAPNGQTGPLACAPKGGKKSGGKSRPQ